MASSGTRNSPTDSRRSSDIGDVQGDLCPVKQIFGLVFLEVVPDHLLGEKAAQEALAHVSDVVAQSAVADGLMPQPGQRRIDFEKQVVQASDVVGRLAGRLAVLPG